MCNKAASMDFADDILSNIPFDYVNPYKNEIYGLYRIETPQGCAEFIKIAKGQLYEPHIHDIASAQFIFVMGEGKVLMDDKTYDYKKGSVFNVPKGIKHGFIVDSDTSVNRGMINRKFVTAQDIINPVI